MNDCFCKRSGQIPHAASRVMSATMGSRRVVVVVRAARERRAVSWTGGAGWRAAPSTLLSLALGSGRESFAARCSHGRQSDCQAQRAPPTRASSRGTLAHPPARPPSCCERADCAGLAIILRSTSARCCATATATAGTFLLAARSCGAPRRTWQAAGVLGDAGTPTAAKAASASEPASRTAQAQAQAQAQAPGAAQFADAAVPDLQVQPSRGLPAGPRLAASPHPVRP